MVSFQAKFAQGLSTHGIEVCYDLDSPPYDAVLVIGGTRQLAKLLQVKKRGIRIVQRLNGMNWIHRVRKRFVWRGSMIRHFLRSEYGNFILSTIRSRFADHIIYQSNFSRDWWERVYGPTPVSSNVVYNGVELNHYSPVGSEQPPDDHVRILLVEGNLMGGYEMGIEVAVKFAKQFQQNHPNPSRKPVELLIVGRVDPSMKDNWHNQHLISSTSDQIQVTWCGEIPPDQIPKIDRSAHLLYSADLNPACPNSVIEALACGLPVVAFATGALPELVTPEAGCLVPYGGDPWKLDPPDIETLAARSQEIINNPSSFRKAARQLAERKFGLDQMVAGYLEQLL